MDDDKVVSNHQEHVLDYIKSLKSDKRLLDFRICVGNETLMAHKIVLAASSDYFRAMFAHNSQEFQQNCVVFREIDPVIMKSILNFCYDPHIDLTMENVQDILFAASMLQIKSIQELCVNFIRDSIDTTNCLSILVSAARCNLTDLMEEARKFCLERFCDIIKENEFVELDKDTLIDIIEHDNLKVDNELDVFQAIVYWVNADKSNRIVDLPSLMKHVRFASMNPVDLLALDTNELIRESPFCLDLIRESKDYLLMKYHPKLTDQAPENLNVRTKTESRCSVRKRLYAVGGWTDEFRSIAVTEVYDPSKDEWTVVEPMTVKRCGVGSAALGDSIYAIGGHDGDYFLNSVERYDVNRCKWFKDVAPMNHVRTSFGVTTLNNQIYVVGGQMNTGATDKVERYDPRCKTWIECAPLNIKRLGPGVATFEGRIYAMGGGEYSAIYNSVECYDPIADKWFHVECMKVARKHLGAATCNGKIYAVGGRNGLGELDSAECYDPAKNSWSFICQMPMKRSGIGLVEMSGLLYAVGGSLDDARLDIVEAYDPKADCWIKKKPMLHGRLAGGVAVHPPSKSF